MDFWSGLVAVLGIGSATFTALYGLRAQSRREAGIRLLEAKVSAYGECTHALYEYERSTYDRVKKRLAGRIPSDDREALRQEAYRANSVARACIGRVAVLSNDEELWRALDHVRESIGQLNRSAAEADLVRSHEAIYVELNDTLKRVREELAR